MEMRNNGAVAEILKRSADKLLKDTFELSRVFEWIPKQVGEKEAAFSEYLRRIDPKNDKPDSMPSEEKFQPTSVPTSSQSQIQMVSQKNTQLQLIDSVIKLRKGILRWLTEKGQDTNKLTQISRSLGQREMQLKQVLYFNIESDLAEAQDLTRYLGQGALDPDYSNCMAGSDRIIESLNDFLVAFAPMNSWHWKWSKLHFDYKNPHCKPYFRRNAELLLRGAKLHNTNQEAIQQWAPKSFREYQNFVSITSDLLNLIVSLPTMERTLEDYIILMRLQRIAWRVAQAMDQDFAVKDPKRHIGLLQYTLAVPQCHRLLQGKMEYSNHFLADSGAYGNILDTKSVTELNELCQEMVIEESAGKAVLDAEKYLTMSNLFVDRKQFDKINQGDREIYYKMAQNARVAQTVAESHDMYDFGSEDVTANAARAAALGEAGVQFIYYQFFDVMRVIFTASTGVKNPVQAASIFKFTLIPMRLSNEPSNSLFLVFDNKQDGKMNLGPVNVELMKGPSKSYIKTSVTEMITSHILGLDVMLNHLVRGSSTFWSSDSIFDDGRPEVTGFFLNILKILKNFFEQLMNLMKSFSGNFQPPKQDPNEVRAFRKTVAGSADFLLNCSSHLLRKIDVAPGYEELVMTLLMNAFGSIDKELSKALKELEKSETDSFTQTQNKVTDPYAYSPSEASINQDYLKNEKTSPDQHLKSLINWATIAIRFAGRVRTLKPEWSDRFPDLPMKIYSSMIKYSRAKASNNRRLAPVDAILVGHVDYLLYMVCVLNMHDPNLRNAVYDNLKTAGDDGLVLTQDSSILTAAMVFHRFLALSSYEYKESAPLTDDFIQNQFGASAVMAAIRSLKDQNEVFLILFADFIARYIETDSEDILSRFPQGANLDKGVLIYERFALNLIQGSFTENGQKTRDPNSILRYAAFRQYFASNEPVVPFLGPYTEECPNRFEIKDFLQKGTRYSICEDPIQRTIAIYRHIPRFRRPCLLVRKKRVIESLQETFSVYSNSGIDLYMCQRGNNAHFVWIPRNGLNAEYITHGRLWHIHNVFTINTLSIKFNMEQAKDDTLQAYGHDAEFEFNRGTRLQDRYPGLNERFFTPTVFFPRIEICEVDSTPVFPLTAETKLMVLPEPLIRFSGGSRFGSYMLRGNRLIFLFQKFRFRDRPDVALTFVEDAQGDLEMRGREDLKVCEDQIFENDFWPALMMRKTEDPEADIRIAFVPITNPDVAEKHSDKQKDLNNGTEVSLKFDLEAATTNAKASSGVLFMEAMAVEKYLIKTIIKENGSPHFIYGYKLKPSSRLQRILLAYHNLNLRNYDASLKLLDPRAEIDHNTAFTEDELTILNWMVDMKDAQEPEALALRFMAKIHLILDAELFPKKSDTDKVSTSSSGVLIEGVDDSALDADFENDADLVKSYRNAQYSEKWPTESPSSFVSSQNEKKQHIGAYFVALPLLPKRFHIDQVFKDSMSSRALYQFLHQQYSSGILYPGISKVLSDNFGKILKFGDENSACLSDILKYDLLSLKALDPLTKDEEALLDESIHNRLLYPYMIKNCKLLPLMIRKLLQIHDSGAPMIPSDFQEFIVMYLYMTGNKSGLMEKYLIYLAHPSSLAKHGIANIQENVNLSTFKTELTPYLDYDKKMVLPMQEHLTKLYNAVQFDKNVASDDALYRKYSERDSSSDPSTDAPSLIKPILPNSTDAPSLIKPILPKGSAKKNEGKDGQINSIKFTAEDFHYVRLEDRELYTQIMERIEAARSAKTHDSGPSAPELQLVPLFEESKTQNALQVAISDYMNARREPIIFDNLQKNIFEPLAGHISARSEVLRAELVKLEAKYDRFFDGMREDGRFLPGRVLSNLKRIFNHNEKPKLKDLRDCFMQMNRGCLRNRLPEMNIASITKIIQLLKSFYIQQIILNNLTAVNRKISEFNSLAQNAALAETKLSTCTDSALERSLKTDIFDYKDTALLYVEDIFNDMEKLLYLEVRLQDPITLNFEFMSAKFHLTNVQVQDIANLATRNWENELRLEVTQRIKDNPDVSREDLIKENSLVSHAILHLRRLVKRFAVRYRKDKSADHDSRHAEWKARGSVQKKDESSDYENENKHRKLNKKDETIPIDDQFMVAAKDLWAYMPRQEAPMFEYKEPKRPVLENIKKVGELKPFFPLYDTYFSRVIQRKMAAGKTTVLGTAATVKKADGKTLSVLVILSSLFQSSAPDMQKRTSEFFNTRGIAFSMPKPRLTIPSLKDESKFEYSFLTWTLTTLVTAINSKSYLVVTPETLQAFLNSYVEFLDAFVNTPGGRYNPELSRCLHVFATIYDLFRTRGSLILDEIDSSMRPQKELNFPTTKRENILSLGVELTSDLLLFSALDKDVLAAGLNLLANQQYALTDEQYVLVRQVWRGYIKTQLEDKKSRWHEVFFPNTLDAQLYNVERLLKFLFDPSPLDKSQAVSPENIKADKELQDELNWMARVRSEGGDVIFHAMMVVKMQIKNWFRNCFKGAVNEHYGPSLDTASAKRLLYAIPYMAANTPAEGSIFADRWETVNKTFMLYLVKQLSLEDLSMILLDLRAISQNNDSTMDIKAEFSKACPGFDLLNLKFNNQNKVVDRTGKVAQCMAARSESSLRLIFIWVIKIVFENEQFYAEQITSNAINLTTMFPSVQGYSGTIDNVNILPHQVMIDAEDDHRINEQANGAITMKLLQQQSCVTTVQRIETFTKLDALLDAMCRDFDDLSGFSAFVDVGALFKDFKNSQVALALAKKFKRRVILYYDERSNQLSFLEYDSKKNNEIYMALEGSETNYLNSATGSLVKDRFTYYDQRHITGSDILQPPTARAFLTIGPKVLLRDILQGVMRMRQFQSGQSIHFVTTSAVENLLANKCERVLPPTPKGTPRVSQHHLIALGAINEDEKQLAENVRLYRVKIDAEIRAFVMDRLTAALAEVDPYSERKELRFGNVKLVFGAAHEKLFKKTRSLFIRDVHENPANWATINVQTDTKKAVKDHCEGRINMIPVEWKTGANKEEWKKVEENLKILVQDLPEDKEESEKSIYAQSLLRYLKPTIEQAMIPDQFKGSKSEIVEQGSTVEMELQLELQQELQLELEQALSISYDATVLPEPELSIPRENLKDPFDQTTRATTRKSKPGEEFKFIDSIEKLETPWKLDQKFGRRSLVDKELQKLFDVDLLCPGISNGGTKVNVEQYCKNLPGFVGMSHGVSKICSSREFDFATMSAREATHLLFWRGRSEHSQSTSEYKRAVFLLTGSEARSLHAYWDYKSCLVSSVDSFWLTDLLGFEIHGAPLASTAFSSKNFSLLEKEYKEHFADLHFRALALNGSYNVIMASRDLYLRMRAWLGDSSLGKEYFISKTSASLRAKYFLNRLTWMSKMRSEIAPDDPFIKDISRLTMKLPVDFEQSATKYEEHLIRGTSMSTYSNNLTKNLETPGQTRWSLGRNVNKAAAFAWKGLLIFLACLSILILIAFIWGKSTGIDWVEFAKIKWALILSLWSRKSEDAEDVEDDESLTTSTSEAEAEINHST